MMKDFILNLDRPRKLKFGFKASRLIREMFGKKDIEALRNMNVDEFAKVAYCGLVWDDETLTVEKVEELIDAKIPEAYTVTGIIKILSEAIAAHMGVSLTRIGGTAVKKKTKKPPTETIPSRKSGK